MFMKKASNFLLLLIAGTAFSQRYQPIARPQPFAQMGSDVYYPPPGNQQMMQPGYTDRGFNQGPSESGFRAQPPANNRQPSSFFGPTQSDDFFPTANQQPPNFQPQQRPPNFFPQQQQQPSQQVFPRQDYYSNFGGGQQRVYPSPLAAAPSPQQQNFYPPPPPPTPPIWPAANPFQATPRPPMVVIMPRATPAPPPPAPVAPVFLRIPATPAPNFRDLADMLPDGMLESSGFIIPPSPLSIECPEDYICCGKMKHHNPDKNLRCCGNSSFTPPLQSCQNGKVVSIILARLATEAPTVPPVYVQVGNLKCEGVSWQAPFPNYKCCGPSIYNTQTETCREGVVGYDYGPLSYSGDLINWKPRTDPLPPPTPEPIPVPLPFIRRQTTPSPFRIISCQGNRFRLSDDDAPFYGCCGADLYYVQRESCDNGRINPPRIPESANLPPVSYGRPAETNSNNNNNFFDSTRTNPWSVDGQDAQSSSMLLVCDNVQRWVAEADRQYVGCCGTNLFDIRQESCQQPFGLPGLTGGPVGAILPLTRNAANCPARQICCDNSPPVDNRNGRLRCCPGIGPFDPNISRCGNLK